MGLFSADPKLASLEDIIEEVPRCPKCGHEGYVVVPQVKGKSIELVAVSCAKCKTDILRAYWTLRNHAVRAAAGPGSNRIQHAVGFEGCHRDLER